MYQFYYSDRKKVRKKAIYKQSIEEKFEITAIRPTMWEEHCLECSAPLCFESCVHYLPRTDGRCMRFENGIYVYQNQKGCAGQAARVKFRKWANMMTVLFPAMIPTGEYKQMVLKNQKLGRKMKGLLESKVPRNVRWNVVRTVEFLRRKRLRKISGIDNHPDAFIFHGFSFEEKDFNLIIEIYESHTSVFKTAIPLKKGENLCIIPMDKLSKACWENNNLVKIYPENDMEAELDILWCDFVKGQSLVIEQPADKVKCVVWDLDNTLWDGILIETENPEHLKLKEHVFETVKALDERGIIQSIASKNDYEPAWNMIKKLGIDQYFLYPQIHWNAKSSSIENIAKKLNIGIDSLALIDDSEFERKQVKSIWKQARVYSEKEVDTLLSRKEFDVMITAESKQRRELYRAEEKRNELMELDNTDTVEFLKKCNLQMSIFVPETEEEINRCYELLLRTNQLNMSGNKYSREEFNEILSKGNVKNFAVSCKDDFGSYGIVGYGQYEILDAQVFFREFAMSCRVAGKYVESGLFHEILNRENCEKGYFYVLKTKKNSLLRRTLQEIGFQTVNENEKKIKYRFDKELKNRELVKVKEKMQHG